MTNILFTKDICEKNEISGNNSVSQRAQIKNKFSSFKFNLINFVKESEIKITKDNQNFSNFLWENYKSYQLTAIKYIDFIIASLIFFRKIIHNKHLQKSGI